MQNCFSYQFSHYVEIFYNILQIISMEKQIPIVEQTQKKQVAEARKKLRTAIIGQLIRKKKQDQLNQLLGVLLQKHPNLKKGLLHNQMGCAFSSAGKNEKAEQHLKKSQQMVSEFLPFSNVYMNLGNLEAQKKNFNKAIQYYQKVLSTSPYNKQIECPKQFQELRYLGRFNSYDAYVDAHTNLSVMYANNDEAQKGFKYCQKAIELNPNSIQANINYGDILRQVGKKDEAIEHTWNQIVKITRQQNQNYQRNPWIQIKPLGQSTGLQQQKFINILCVKWGKRYGPDYVNKLYKGIQKNTTWKFKFFCFTDDSVGLHQNIISMPLEEGWTGWWGKVTLFKQYKQIVGKKFYIDLDMIVTGNLDDIFSYQGQFGTLSTQGIACEKQHKSGYNSSIMIWSESKLASVYEALKANFKNIKKVIVRFDFWLQMNIKKADYLQECFPGQIADFLQSCQKQVPAGTRIVCFPRKPKPDAYPAEWIKDYWVQ